MPRPRFRFAACKVEEYRVDGQCCVRYAGSSTCEYARRRVELRAYHDRIEFYAGGKQIKVCPRSYVPGSNDYDYHDYIRLLRRAPGASLNGRPYLKMPDTLLQYRVLLLERCPRREAARHLAKVLEAVLEAGESRVCEAVQLAMASGTVDSDAVLNLLEQLRKASVPRCGPLDMESRPELETFKVPPPEPARCDGLQEVRA